MNKCIPLRQTRGIQEKKWPLTLGVLEVVAPQWPDLVLAAHIPHSEADILVLTVTTLKPMVAMVVTISPSFSLYRIVVFPAASRPTMRMRISFFAKKALEEVCKDIPHASGQVEAILARDLRKQVITVLLCAASVGPGAGQRHTYPGVPHPTASPIIPPEKTHGGGETIQSQVAEKELCPPDRCPRSSKGHILA